MMQGEPVWAVDVISPRDDLEGFCQFVMQGKCGPFGWMPSDAKPYMIEDVVALTWYRQPPYQVQMFIVPAGYVIPEHVHPNVDSIECYVGGTIRFSHSGQWVLPEEALMPGSVDKKGALIRVRPGDRHGGLFGANGGVFWSIQKWLNGVEPHCVAADYAGPVMGRRHADHVQSSPSSGLVIGDINSQGDLVTGDAVKSDHFEKWVREAS